METNRVFLACYDRGVARAEQDDEGQWTVTQELPELKVTCLATDPSDRQVVYAGSHQQGVWRSDDGGRSWRAAGMEGRMVKSLAVSPHDSNVIYAGTKPAHLYRTTDGAQSWTELGGFRRIPNRWWWFSPAEPPGLRPYVMAIALSPEEPDMLLAGVELGAVVYSEDGGLSWSRHRRGALRDCHSLKYHSSDGKWAYEAGGTGGGASFSRDGGRSWQKAKRGLAKNYGIVCAADPGDPETWYVCVAPGPGNAFGSNPAIYLYRSTPGNGWQPIGWQAHPLPMAPTALVTLPDRPGHLYAGLKNGDVWHTSDYGDTWEQLSFNLNGIWFGLVII